MWVSKRIFFFSFFVFCFFFFSFFSSSFSPLSSFLTSSLTLHPTPLSQITIVFNFIKKNKTVLSRFEDEFYSRKTINKETQQPVSLSASYFANNSAGINNCETVISLMLHFPGFEKMNEALNIIGTALCVREMLFKSLRESELAGCAGCTGSCSDDARLQAKVRTDKHVHCFLFRSFSIDRIL